MADHDTPPPSATLHYVIMAVLMIWIVGLGLYVFF